MSILTASESPYGHLSRQMGRVMDQLQKGFFSFCPAETWTPAVNLYETDDAYLVCMDLAGVDREKIEVGVIESTLLVKGQRITPEVPRGEAEACTPRVRVHLMEIDHGAFCREVKLPQNVLQENITAAHVNGLLWITLPKKA